MTAGKRQLLAGLAAGLLLIGALFGWRGAEATWRLWGVGAADRSFIDMRVITSAAPVYRAGLDPLYQNPHDIFKRPVNYPRVWQWLYRAGIEERHTAWLAGISIGLFFVMFFLATPPVSAWGRVAGLLLAVFSPAIALACERGNTDLVIFAVLAMAVVMDGTAWAFLLVMAAFVLKLFPLAALTVVFRGQRQTAWRYLIAGIGFAGLYLAYNLSDLRQIIALTPRDSWLSYGSSVIGLKARAAGWSSAGMLIAIGGLVAVGWLLFAVRRGWRQAAPAPAAAGEPGLAGFRVGAACYVGTFLIGTNFDYKLMFLLLALPQLQVWAGDPRSEHRRWARFGLVGLYYSCWRLAIDPLLAAVGLGAGAAFALSEAAHWILFVTLAWLLVCTLPSWWRGLGEDVWQGRQVP